MRKKRGEPPEVTDTPTRADGPTALPRHPAAVSFGAAKGSPLRAHQPGPAEGDVSSHNGSVVRKLLDLIAMSAGGWLGWTAGAWISTFAAFILGVVGTGAGLYVGRRVTAGFLP